MGTSEKIVTDSVGGIPRERWHCSKCGKWTIGVLNAGEETRLFCRCDRCGEVTEALRMVAGPRDLP